MTRPLDENLHILSTVYSWVMPETEALLNEINTDPEHQHSLKIKHRCAWDGRQDRYHESFFDTWFDWVDPINKPTGTHVYPTAGSSEGIRESLAQFASLAKYKPHLGVPTIHVFEGEYEGYRALAEPYGIRVVQHSRNNWRKALREIIDDPRKGEGQKFYISHPSSIDGNLWGEFSTFLNAVHNLTNLKVMLDLCYVGCVPEDRYGDEKIPADHPVVDTVFFSLSKVFGLYYHRIGGMITHTEHPGLWGNKWFKNLTSLYIGEQFMGRYDCYELPEKYDSMKQQVLEDLDGTGQFTPQMGSDLRSSDVFLLANQSWTGSCEMTDLFSRCESGGSHTNRYCLTEHLYFNAEEHGLYDRVYT